MPVARLIRLIPPPLSLRGVNVVRYVTSNGATIEHRERKKTDVFLFKNSQSTIQYQFSSSNSKNMLFSPIFITKLSIPRKKSVTLFTVIIEFPYQLSVQRDPNVHEQTTPLSVDVPLIPFSLPLYRPLLSLVSGHFYQTRGNCVRTVPRRSFTERPFCVSACPYKKGPIREGSFPPIFSSISLPVSFESQNQNQARLRVSRTSTSPQSLEIPR